MYAFHPVQHVERRGAAVADALDQLRLAGRLAAEAGLRHVVALAEGLVMADQLVGGGNVHATLNKSAFADIASPNLQQVLKNVSNG
jgi:hypothetical protein